jgi:hypothetical protein
MNLWLSFSFIVVTMGVLVMIGVLYMISGGG